MKAVATLRRTRREDLRRKYPKFRARGDECKDASLWNEPGVWDLFPC